MAAGITYSPIATQTLSSTAASVAFSSITGTYTDLVLVISARDSRTGNSDSIGITFNTDTSTGSTNYSVTLIDGNGSSASSSRDTSARNISGYQIAASNAAAGTFGTVICNILNYSNSTTYKSLLLRGGIVDSYLATVAGLWRNTAAINTITIYPGYNGSGFNFSIGSTFTLYGIASA